MENTTYLDYTDVDGGGWPLFTVAPCPVGEEDTRKPPPKDFYSWLPAPSQGFQYPSWEIALKVTSYVITMLIGGVGNIMVILIVVLSRRMRNKTNLYVANLAASDVMVSLLCMWVHLGNNISTEWPFTAVMCSVNNFFQAWSVTASVLFLTVIAGDRFFAIVYPLRAKRSGRSWTAGVLVAAMWLVAALVAGPHLFTWEMGEIQWSNRHEKWCGETWPRYFYETSTGECLSHTPTRTIYITVHVVILYFLPIVVISCAYGIVGWTLWKRKIPGHASSKSVVVQMKSRKKVVRMLVIVLTVFVVCWTPQQIVVLYDTYRPHNQPLPTYFRRSVKYVVTYVAYLNSAINPVLYGGLNDNFRQGFREAFKCALCLRKNRVTALTGRWTQDTDLTASRKDAGTHTSPEGSRRLGPEGCEVTRITEVESVSVVPASSARGRLNVVTFTKVEKY